MGGIMKRIVLFFAVALLLGGYGFFAWGQTKTVWVPKIGDMAEVSGANQEILDMTDEDPIALRSFKDLAEAKFELNRPYIIARVESSEGTHAYYDAHALNESLFGFLGLTGFKPLDTYTDPRRNKIARLDYFILNNADEEAFTYLCSYVDLITRPEYWRDFFYSNQPAPKLSLVKKYEVARGIIATRQRDSYQVAFNYLEYVANEKIQDVFLVEPEEKVQAVWRSQALLADLYYHGLQSGPIIIVPKDFKESARYWMMLLDNEKVDQYDVANAKLRLGNIYKEGDQYVPANYATAYGYYIDALKNAQCGGFLDIEEQAECGKQEIEKDRERALRDIALEALRVKADQTLSSLDRKNKLKKISDLERAVRSSGAHQTRCVVQ
jgi:hypothetical protein